MAPKNPSSDDSTSHLPPLPKLRPLPGVPPVGRWTPKPPAERVAPLPPLPNFRPIFAPATPTQTGPQVTTAPAANPVPVPANPTGDDTVRLPDTLGRRRRHRRTATRPAGPALHTDDKAVDAPAAPRGRALVVGTSERSSAALIATQLTHSGYRIALQQPDPGESDSDRISDLLSRGHLVAAADHTDPESLSVVVEQVSEVFGRLDLLVVATSGVTGDGPPDNGGDSITVDVETAVWSESWSQALSQEILGTAVVVQSAARVFAAGGHPGHIILVVPSTGNSALAAAVAHGLSGLATGLADELRDRQVRVTVVGGSSSDWEPSALAEVVAKVATSVSVPGVSIRSC